MFVQVAFDTTKFVVVMFVLNIFPAVKFGVTMKLIAFTVLVETEAEVRLVITALLALSVFNEIFPLIVIFPTVIFPVIFVSPTTLSVFSMLAPPSTLNAPFVPPDASAELEIINGVLTLKIDPVKVNS